ncbi:toluene-4-monooxygenase system B family protein [Pseudonocardia acidicola]|uniref:toluene-4-monooxygenase system B family protein n=1 Tax=Pseudonocardia acidicola TaxID=2724939 RepID=UPI00308435EA
MIVAPFPVQGIVEGDFVIVLVPVDTEDPMPVVAEKIAYHAVNRRVPERDQPMAVRHNGRVLAPESTVVDAGVAPLDVLEVIYT